MKAKMRAFLRDLVIVLVVLVILIPVYRSVFPAWELVRELDANGAKFALYRSRKPVAENGTGGLTLHAFRVTTEQDGVVGSYERSSEEGIRPASSAIGLDYYVDDVLEARDVTNDGVPEIIFHSGYVGASDAVSLNRILYYDPIARGYRDITDKNFSNSGLGAMEWVRAEGVMVAIVAAAIPERDAQDGSCHYCPHRYAFSVYRWKIGADHFVKVDGWDSEKSFATPKLAMVAGKASAKLLQLIRYPD